MAFAEGTEVSIEKSQQEIASIVRKYGADGFVSGWQGKRSMIEFVASGRRIRFVLETPAGEDWKNFTLTPSKQRRTEIAAKKAMESEARRRWRALALVIKAKLDVVQSGITTFETEFLANIVMPDGRIVAEHVAPAIAESYNRGQISGQLLAIGDGS